MIAPQTEDGYTASMEVARPRYQWLVFDADGTLFDFRCGETVALKSTTHRYGVSFSPHLHEVYAEISADLWGRFERGEMPLKLLRVIRFERLFSDLDIDVEPEAFNSDFMEALGRQTQLLDGAEEVVRDLSLRFRLLLATNGIAVVQRARFSRSSIRQYFHDVVISDEIGVAKPQTEYMEEVFSRMGHPLKSEVLMIGDSLSSDISAGAGFGIDTCWFNPNGIALDGGPRPTFTIADLSEIAAIVSGGSPTGGLDVNSSSR
jgi:YjjG family noncanonical pyrimidine nucleotidase